MSPDEGLQHPEQNADGKLDALPERPLPCQMKLGADDGLAAELIETQHDRLVVKAHVLGQRPDGMAHGRLFAQQEADRSQYREAARLGQAQPECIDLGLLGRQLEQLAHRLDGNPHFRIGEGARIDADR